MSRKKIAFVLAVAALLLLPACHRLGIVKSPAKEATRTAEATTTASASSAASTTAGASAVSVSVQNGGGVKGRGAAMVAKLQSLGYTIESKATNAKLRYPTTVIYYKAGDQGEAQQVRQSLGLGTVHKAPAKLAFTTDVVVIVGKDF